MTLPRQDLDAMTDEEIEILLLTVLGHCRRRLPYEHLNGILTDAIRLNDTLRRPGPFDPQGRARRDCGPVIRATLAENAKETLEDTISLDAARKRRLEPKKP